jgi:hypothetical protein
MNSKSLLVIAALTSLACAKDKPAADPGPAPGTKLGETAGMNVPESVRYDAELDVYYVSNVNGNPSKKDNNGFIARVRADSTSVTTMLVEGGKNGVTLNAPKGMALVGDTLWVADIDALRGFDRRTGALIRQYELGATATFLNDVSATPDGNVYITDTGIKYDDKGNATHPGKDQIFRMLRGSRAAPESFFVSDSLLRPNGITWVGASNGMPGRFLVAPFGGPSILMWTPGDKQPAPLTSGPGGFDGIEALPNGNVLVSSWADSSVWIAHGGTHMVQLIKNVSAPADIGVDTKRNVLAIPRFNDGKVEYYKLP